MLLVVVKMVVGITMTGETGITTLVILIMTLLPVM